MIDDFGTSRTSTAGTAHHVLLHHGTDDLLAKLKPATTADRNWHASGAKARAEIAGIRTGLIHQRRAHKAT